MMTPKTGLGKLLWRDLNGMISRGQSLPSGADTWIERAIAASEAEAVAAERERIRTAVRGLEPCCDDAAVILPDRRTLRAMCQCGAYVRDAVLDIVNPEETDHD